MRPAGTRRHTVRIESPVTTRNAVGEAVQSSWVTIARRRASVEQVAYSETEQGKQQVGEAAYELVFPYAAGFDASCRLVVETMAGRVVYPTSVLTEERDEHVVRASEKAV